MFQRFRRIVFDDSSDDDVSFPTSTKGTNSFLTNDDSKISDEGDKDKDNETVNKNYQEVGSLTDAISNLNVNNKKNNGIRSFSISENNENTYYTSDDSYQEDSFVIKDSTESDKIEGEESSMSLECIDLSEAERLFPFSMQLRDSLNPSNRNRRSRSKSSSVIKPYDLSFYSSEADFQLNSVNLQNTVDTDVSRVTISRESDGSGNESEECFDTYVRRIKKEQERKKNPYSVSKTDLKSFVIDDDDSVEVLSGPEDKDYECSGSSESYEENLESNIKEVKEKTKGLSLQETYLENELAGRRLLKKYDDEQDIAIDEHIFEIFSNDLLPDSKPVSLSQKELNRVEVFLLCLASEGSDHRYARTYVREKFSKIREELTRRLFRIYWTTCFEGRLDSCMKIEWNPRLLKTAGRCLCMKDFTAKIELSIKVCNKPERVRDTLLHELCHAAVFVIDKTEFGRHGPAWQKWVRQCMNVFPRMPVIQRCHQYSIDAKYHYICNVCGQTIKRHSKSLDLERYRCGVCKGHFVLHNSRGQQIGEKQKKANPFAKYVQDNYKKFRSGGKKHAEVMKILSQEFKQLSCSSEELLENKIIRKDSNKENEIYAD